MIDRLLVDVEPPLVLRRPRQLLVHGDGFRRLPDGDERTREQTQGIEVLRVCLEADLQLGERKHAVARLAPFKVELRRLARERRVVAVMQQALEDLQCVFAAFETNQNLRGSRKMRNRLFDLLDTGVGLGQPQVRQGIGAVESDDLLEDLDGTPVLTGTLHWVATSSYVVSASLTSPSWA